MLEWIALRPTRKVLRTNSRGVLPNLARAIVAIAVRRPLRERTPYKELAQIFSRAIGCLVNERHIKDIRIKCVQIPRQCIFQLSAADIEFARRYGTNPIAINQMREAIVPGSIAESQFAEIWERRPPAPVLMIVRQRRTETIAALGNAAVIKPEAVDEMATGLKPASPDERAELARTERAVQQAQDEQGQDEQAIVAQVIVAQAAVAQAAVAQDQPLSGRTRPDQARIDKWIRDRLVDWGDSCWQCRKPIVVGQTWTVVANGEVSARFHQDCHDEWLAQQEAFARRALGFAA
jgi:hypothetical protein